mmetsp:Transcript_22238/g.29258  ORF Transcript_22238/g.29258 Transcript_22238/m.29258 type:complete len:181 (-) Transcript_22238:4-546(-)
MMMLSARSILPVRSRIIPLATRSFATQAQSLARTKTVKSQDSSTLPLRASSALLLAAGVGLMAATTVPERNVKMEEYKPQELPKQKYPSPKPNPIHGKESHHSDYNDPPSRPDLPTIPLEEVQEHNDLDDMWFTFRGAIYDLSFFKYGHPGGTPVRTYRFDFLSDMGFFNYFCNSQCSFV